MIISEALRIEVGALSELALRSKRHWGYDDAFMQLCKVELTVRPADLASAEVFVARAHDRDEVFGFYVLRTNEGPAELEMLFVEPSHIGEGVGAALMKHALRVASLEGHLTVNIVSDPFAATFYEHLGAYIVGTSTSSSTGRQLKVYQLATSRFEGGFDSLDR